MRKFILSVLLSLFFSSVVLAQFPGAGAKDFTFGITNFAVNTNAGHTGTVLYKYQKTDSFAFRMSAAVNYNTSGTSSNNGLGKLLTNSSLSYSILAGFGIEKVISRFNRFSVDAGTDLAPSFRYAQSKTKTETMDSTLAGGKNGDFMQTITVSPQVFSIGLYPFIGLNYFITKNFAIGAEFSMGIVYSFPAIGYRILTQSILGVGQPAFVTPNTSLYSLSISPTNTALITGSIYF
jgi:hypothetical protein